MKICIAILAIVLGLGVLKVWRPKVFILILSGVILCTVAAAMQESSRKSDVVKIG